MAKKYIIRDVIRFILEEIEETTDEQNRLVTVTAKIDEFDNRASAETAKLARENP